VKRSGSLSGMTRALRKLGNLKPVPSSASVALTNSASVEAAELADFCADARAEHMHGGTPASVTLCEVLAAFQFAFQTESNEVMNSLGRRARRE